jgi:hypothetical protein
MYIVDLLIFSKKPEEKKTEDINRSVHILIEILKLISIKKQTEDQNKKQNNIVKK